MDASDVEAEHSGAKHKPYWVKRVRLAIVKLTVCLSDKLAQRKHAKSSIDQSLSPELNWTQFHSIIDISNKLYLLLMHRCSDLLLTNNDS